MNNTFSADDVAVMLSIAGEANELAADETARRTHILNRLLSLIGGCSAVCTEIESAGCWALPGSITRVGELSASQQATIDRYVSGELAALDPCVPALLRQRGEFSTIRRGDVVDDDAWFRCDHFNQVRRPLGFGEAIYAKLVTPDGRRLKLSFHRESGDKPYDADHARLVQIFNQSLSRLYVVPSHESVAALPPRLRPVLRRLLAGDAEKQAAMKLGLSRHTVHEYTRALYRSFGVNSRGELLAKFVANV